MGEMSFADYEGEFRELCEHAESDMAALRNSPSGSYNTKGVLKQVEWDLKEAAVQIRNLEVSASECSSRAQAAKQIQVQSVCCCAKRTLLRAERTLLRVVSFRHNCS